MNKIMIISDLDGQNHSLNSIDSSEVEYVLIDSIEYSVAYLFSNTKEKCPNIVYIDNNNVWIKKFIRLCKELHIDLESFKLITSVEGQYHHVNMSEHATSSTISTNDFKNYLYK